MQHHCHRAGLRPGLAWPGACYVCATGHPYRLRHCCPGQLQGISPSRMELCSALKTSCGDCSEQAASGCHRDPHNQAFALDTCNSACHAPSPDAAMQANIRLNAHAFRTGQSAARAKRLDWQHGLPGSNSSSCTPGNSLDGYAWSQEDLQTLASCDLIIAADVVYDDKMTDAFLDMTRQLLRHVRRTGHGTLGKSAVSVSVCGSPVTVCVMPHRPGGTLQEPGCVSRSASTSH